MKDLKTAFESLGFSDVLTYIQSGNVIFTSDKKNVDSLTDEIENMLKGKFLLNSKIILLSTNQLKQVVENVPSEWRKKKDIRCYIAFIKKHITEEEVVKEIQLKEGVDFIKVGKGVIYMTTLLSGLTKSGFTKLVRKKIFQDITIRNFNTTQKLLQLIENL